MSNPFGNTDVDARRAGESGDHSVAHGVAGYRKVQELLAEAVSPDEAQAAAAMFRRSRRAFLAVSLSYLALQGLKGWLLPVLTPARGAVDDALTAAVLLSVLVLISRYGVTFAGRLLWTLHFTSLTFKLPEFDWWMINWDGWVAFSYIVGPVLGFVLGTLIDLAAAPRIEGQPSVVQRLVLATAGALGIAFWMTQWWRFKAGMIFPVFSILGCAACGMWNFWPGPMLARPWRTGPLDVRIVAHKAMAPFHSAGRSGAVAACASSWRSGRALSTCTTPPLSGLISSSSSSCTAWSGRRWPVTRCPFAWGRASADCCSCPRA
jgi:hypothetical protein